MRSARTVCQSNHSNELPADNAGYQWTYWHNLLFNPRTAAHSLVLAFQLNWDQAHCNPPPPL